MRSRFQFLQVLGMAFLAGMVGCASTAKQESTGEFIDDSAITAGNPPEKPRG